MSTFSQARKPEIHDYSGPHRYWGHDYAVITRKDNTLNVSGWSYRRIYPDDVLQFDSANGGTCWYVVTKIEWERDPDDMFNADLVLLPTKTCSKCGGKELEGVRSEDHICQPKKEKPKEKSIISRLDHTRRQADDFLRELLEPVLNELTGYDYSWFVTQPHDRLGRFLTVGLIAPDKTQDTEPVDILCHSAEIPFRILEAFKKLVGRATGYSVKVLETEDITTIEQEAQGKQIIKQVFYLEAKHDDND